MTPLSWSDRELTVLEGVTHVPPTQAFLVRLSLTF